MTVSLVQMDIAWESPGVNRDTAERLMLSAEKSDIFVLPEMWNTGVTTEPHKNELHIHSSPTQMHYYNEHKPALRYS